MPHRNLGFAPGSPVDLATVADLTADPRTDVTIRATSREDVRRVLVLRDQARSAAAVTPDDVRSVSRLIAHTDDALLVAELDSEIVGARIAAWDDWRGNMYRLAVLRHLRRKGTATHLAARTAWNPSLRWHLLSSREYIAGPTVRLLGQFDAGDIETIVRTLQAIAERAAWEAAQE